MAQEQKGLPGFSQQQVEEIVASLIKDKFVDDSRFAGAYVRDKARFSGWGAAKIAYNLKVLGIGSDVISCALEDNRECFDDEKLKVMLQKKWNTLKEDMPLQQKREKTLRFALGRGFQYGQIMEAIKTFR